MKINELFEPQDLPLTDPVKTDWDQKIKFIKEKCSDVILAYQDTNKLLYRGFNQYIEKDVFIEKSPANRASIDSNSLATEIFDYSLIQHNIKALRTNSIFTTSKSFDAKFYTRISTGETDIFVIFPINGFDFSWNKKSSDLIQPNNTDLYKGIMSGHEVCIHGSYVAIRKSKIELINQILA